MRRNSLLAYWNGQREAFSERENAILTAFEWLGMGTDRECMERLKSQGIIGGDMNEVRPRINELIKEGVLEEFGTCECWYTGQVVRKARIARKPTWLEPVVVPPVPVTPPPVVVAPKPEQVLIAMPAPDAAANAASTVVFEKPLPKAKAPKAAKPEQLDLFA
jgi:hypothetical protein